MRITRARMAVAGLIAAAIAGGALVWAPVVGGAAQHAAADRAARELKIVRLRVDGMTCAACPYIVREALTPVDGVVDVKVDHATKTATVVFDPDRTSVDDLTAATGRFGYPSKPLEAGS